MKKGIITLLLSLVIPCAAMAAEGEEMTRLTIEHNNGTSTHMLLTDSPVLTFDGGDMLVKSENIDMRVSRSEISKMHFTKATPTSVENTFQNDYTICYLDGILTVSGENVTEAAVFDTTGRQTDRFQATDGVITADMSAYTPGIYIVAITGHPSIKLLVK